MEPAENEDGQAGSSRRDRSPNYPSLTFSEALEAAKLIWEADKRHPVSQELASQHLGYKKANGASLPMLASLKRYGLAVAVGKDLKISDDAHAIFVHPPGAQEREAIIRRLAMLPSLFREVLEKYPDGLPSDANLRARLQTEWKFASSKAADTFIKALREAVSLAGGSVVADRGQDVDNGGEVAVEAATPMNQENTIRPVSAVVNTALGALTAGRPTAPVAPVGSQARPWDLGGGAVVTVVLPNKLTKKNIEKLKKYVDALALEASIAWDDDDEPVLNLP